MAGTLSLEETVAKAVADLGEKLRAELLESLVNGVFSDIRRDLIDAVLQARPQSPAVLPPPTDEEKAEKKKKKSKKSKKPKKQAPEPMETAGQSATAETAVPSTSADVSTPLSPEKTSEEVLVGGGVPEADASMELVFSFSEESEPEEEQFTTVLSRKAKKRRVVVSESEEDDEREAQLSTKALSRNFKSAKKPQKVVPESRDQNTTSDRPEKIPPVILHRDETTKSWNEVSTLLRSHTISYTKAKAVVGGIRIQPSTVNDFRRMTKLFDVEKLPFHSFSLKSEKPLKVVLRGVSSMADIKSVEHELLGRGFAVGKCSRMMANKKPLDMVVVEVPREHRHIYDLTTVQGLQVTTEPLKKRRSNGQCFRCQQWGHSQRGCHATTRCVKCAGPHVSRECDGKNPKKCANCGGSHPANFRGCPKHPNAGSDKPQVATPTVAAPKKPVPARGIPEASKPKVETGKPAKSAAKQVKSGTPGPLKVTPPPKAHKGQSSATDSNSMEIVARTIGEMWSDFAATKPSPDRLTRFKKQTDQLMEILSQALHG